MKIRLTSLLSFRYLILFLASLGYAILLFTTITHHEIWHEEMQGWLIARDANSLTGLFLNLRYESHQILWYLFLFCITRFTTDPVWMQYFQGILACTGVFLVLRFAPFRLYQRILFILGYFPLYEYGVLSRNYTVGLLFIYCFCIFYRKEKYLTSLVCALLLMQTSVIGLILGIVLGFHVLIDLKPRTFWTGKLLLYILSTLVSVLQVIPPHDYGITVDWVVRFDLNRLGMILLMIWRSFVPLPQFNATFWNTNLLLPVVFSGVQNLSVFSIVSIACSLFGSVLILLGIWSLFKNNRRMLLLFVIGTFSLLGFFYVFYYGAMRHWGYVYILFIACLWMAPELLERKRTGYLFTLLLLIHMIAGMVACFYDYHFVFSAGKQTADYLRSQSINLRTIVSDSDTAGVAVAGYLPYSFYYPREQKWGSFAVITKKRHSVTDSDLLSYRNSVLLLTYPLTSNYCGVRLLKSFKSDIGKGDSYYIYRVDDAGECKGL